MTLEYLIDRAAEKPLRLLQPEMQAILLSGAAQLLLMDRIPAHAAIDEMVELSKSFVREGAAGLTNAVLRKVAVMRGETIDGDGPAMGEPDSIPLPPGRRVRLVGVTLPESPLERLAIATSHPLDLVRHWADRHGGVDAAARLAWHSLCAAPTVLHTAHATQPLPSTLTPHTSPGHHVFAGTHAELVELLRTRQDVWVQDPSSSRAIASIAHLRPSLIIDLCAGQGTKTRQLAATFPQAQIIATDTDAGRFRVLTQAFAGHDRVKVVAPKAMMPDYAGRADLILLDVPCSNTGVLARRVEAKYRWGKAQLDRLVGIQRQIVADAIPMLRASPRGQLLYATCSIDEAENRGIADWAIRWHRDRKSVV